MRQWFHEQLIGDEALMGLLPGGIHAARGFDHVPVDKPFLVHRFSTNRPDIMDGNKAVASTQYVWVWVHDDPGSYTKVDDGLERAKAVLQGLTGSPGSGVNTVRWVDSSDDLFDPDMGTVCRFDRYLITHH